MALARVLEIRTREVRLPDKIVTVRGSIVQTDEDDYEVRVGNRVEYLLGVEYDAVVSELEQVMDEVQEGEL